MQWETPFKLMMLLKLLTIKVSTKTNMVSSKKFAKIFCFCGTKAL